MDAMGMPGTQGLIQCMVHHWLKQAFRAKADFGTPAKSQFARMKIVGRGFGTVGVLV